VRDALNYIAMSGRLAMALDL